MSPADSKLAILTSQGGRRTMSEGSKDRMPPRRSVQPILYIHVVWYALLALVAVFATVGSFKLLGWAVANAVGALRNHGSVTLVITSDDTRSGEAREFARLLQLRQAKIGLLSRRERISIALSTPRLSLPTVIFGEATDIPELNISVGPVNLTGFGKVLNWFSPTRHAIEISAHPSGGTVRLIAIEQRGTTNRRAWSATYPADSDGVGNLAYEVLYDLALEESKMDLQETQNPKAFGLYNEALTALEEYSTRGDWSYLERAALLLGGALSADPSFIRAEYQLAVVQNLLGRHEQAIRTMERIANMDTPFKLEAVYNLATAYLYLYKPESYPKATQAFRDVIRLASARRKQGPSPEAEERARLSLLILMSKANLARVYAHEAIPLLGKEPREASRLLDQADATCRDFDSDLAALGDDIPREDQAEALWIRHNAKGVALMYRGKAASQQEKAKLFELARAEFDEGNKLSRSNVAVLSNLGSLNLFLAESYGTSDEKTADRYLDGAINYFERVLALRPDYDFAYFRLAQIHRRKGDFAGASKLAELAQQYINETPRAELADERKKIQAGDRWG